MVRNATLFFSLLFMIVLLAAVYTGVEAMPTRGGGEVEHAKHLTIAMTAVIVGMTVCVGAILVVMGSEAQIHELEEKLAKLQIESDLDSGAAASAESSAAAPD